MFNPDTLGRRWGPRHSHGSSMEICYCSNYRNPDAFEAHAGSPTLVASWRPDPKFPVDDVSRPLLSYLGQCFLRDAKGVL